MTFYSRNLFLTVAPDDYVIRVISKPTSYACFGNFSNLPARNKRIHAFGGLLCLVVCDTSKVNLYVYTKYVKCKFNKALMDNIRNYVN